MVTMRVLCKHQQAGEREGLSSRVLGPWPGWSLKKTTDGHSLSVALTADTGGISALSPPPECVHTVQMGATWPASVRLTSCCLAFDI